MMTPYLEQLKSQRETINTFLDAQKNSPAQGSIGLRITIQIYTHILEDAIQALNSLIQYLDVNS